MESRVYGAPTPIRPYCFNGTLGMRSEHYREVVYPYTAGCSTIVMFSDGIAGRFEVDWELLAKHPQEISCRLFSGFARTTDDVTIPVAR